MPTIYYQWTYENLLYHYVLNVYHKKFKIIWAATELILCARGSSDIGHLGSPMWVTQPLGKIPIKACLTNLPPKQKPKTVKNLDSTS